MSQTPRAADDVLSQVLDSFRLRGSVGAHLAVRAPWGYAIPQSRDVGLLAVMRGRARFELEAPEPEALELASGDVVALPTGAAFVIRDAPGTPAVPISQTGACSGVEIATAEPQTELLLLHCELSGGCENPVRAALPRIIHCPGSDGRAARWLEPTVRLLALETAMPHAGRNTVLNRLAEVTFVELIRAWLDRQPAECGGWFRAMTDPQLAKALAAFHAEPGHAWTIASLAARAGMSRSAFAARFKALLGVTPLDYVTSWRVQQAKALIEAGRTPLKQVVASLGYVSEAAFRTAFKRRTGKTPGAYRAAARHGAA